jgi:hypothetical protein
LVTLGFAFPITEATVSESLTVYNQGEVCEPAIQLIWKNRLGGDQTYIFQYNQRQSTKIKDNKNVRYLLFADGLTLNDFEVLDDLNSIGEIYSPALIELSSTSKLQAKVGQQVYIVDASGNKTPVVVVSEEYQTETRRKRHLMEVLIETAQTLHPS